MSTPAVRIDVRPDAVAVLTIDQPESKVNVLTPALVAELDAAVDSLAARADVKGLVVASGKPGVFIAGADIKVFANAPGPNDPTVRAYIENGLRVLEKLEALPFPTCAAIDGAALGGGLELALACDYRIIGTSPKVQLGLPEVTLGLIPGWGGTQRLPRIVGTAPAAVMLTSGVPVFAQEACDMGLTIRTNDLLLPAACSLATTTDFETERRKKQFPLSEVDRAAIRLVVQNGLVGTGTAASEALAVLTRGTTYDLYDAIKLETEAFLRLAGSDESKRLIAAFFASRKK